MRNKRLWTHHYVRQILNSLANSKPENTIAQETSTSTNCKNSPRRQLVGGNTRKNTHVFPYIICHSKHCQLLLIVTHNWFQRRGVKGEVIAVSCSYLNPNCSPKTHPWWSASCFQRWHWWSVADAVAHPVSIDSAKELSYTQKGRFSPDSKEKVVNFVENW